MLNLPEQEIQSAEEMMQLLKQKISLMGTTWNDISPSDPGITILELFSFLNWSMQKKLNIVTKGHLRKYLKLLGVTQQPNQCSKAMIHIENLLDKPYVLLKGTQLLANNIPFETDFTKIVYHFQIKKLYCSIQGVISDISRLLVSMPIKEYLFGKKPEEGNVFYLGLSNSLWTTTNHSIYFSLDDSKKRNPFSEKFPFVLSTVQWEYYHNGNWIPAQVCKDETNSFLTSGFVILHIEKQMEKFSSEVLEEAYYLRAVVKIANYDIVPMLCDVSLSSTQAVQKDTICYTFLFSGTAKPKQTYLLEHAIAMNGILSVEVKRENGEWISYPIGHTSESRCNIIVVDETKPFLLFDKHIYGVVPQKDTNNIRVTCYKHGFEKQRLISYGTGLIYQAYQLNFQNIDWNSFSIVSTKPTYYGKRYYDWKQIDSLSDAQENERVYQIDIEENIIYFGDGFHGAVPCEDEAILVSHLAFSLGQNGNIKENEINTFQMKSFHHSIKVTNKTKSIGGQDREGLEQVLESLESMKQFPKRAVTKQQYKQLVLSCWGLAIEKVAVWSNEDFIQYGQAEETLSKNTVYLSVLPHGYEKDSAFFETYQYIIKKYLEQYRLITTKIEVLKPALVGIEVYGTIYIKEQHIVNEQLFHHEIQTYFLAKREFGEELSANELYAAFDKIDCVDYIEAISLECTDRGCQYKNNGVLQLHPNSICYVKNVFLEFKR